MRQNLECHIRSYQSLHNFRACPQREDVFALERYEWRMDVELAASTSPTVGLFQVSSTPHSITWDPLAREYIELPPSLVHELKKFVK